MAVGETELLTGKAPRGTELRQTLRIIAPSVSPHVALVFEKPLSRCPSAALSTSDEADTAKRGGTGSTGQDGGGFMFFSTFIFLGKFLGLALRCGVCGLSLRVCPES